MLASRSRLAVMLCWISACQPSMLNIKNTFHICGHVDQFLNWVLCTGTLYMYPKLKQSIDVASKHDAQSWGAKNCTRVKRTVTVQSSPLKVNVRPRVSLPSCDCPSPWLLWFGESQQINCAYNTNTNSIARVILHPLHSGLIRRFGSGVFTFYILPGQTSKARQYVAGRWLDVQQSSVEVHLTASGGVTSGGRARASAWGAAASWNWPAAISTHPVTTETDRKQAAVPKGMLHMKQRTTTFCTRLLEWLEPSLYFSPVPRPFCTFTLKKSVGGIFFTSNPIVFSHIVFYLAHVTLIKQVVCKALLPAESRYTFIIFGSVCQSGWSIEPDINVKSYCQDKCTPWSEVS